MTTSIRIATANLENVGDQAEDKPPLEVRIPVLQAHLLRLRADVLCLQEIHSQEVGDKRELRALERVLERTQYATYHRAATLGDGEFFEKRNLVVLSRFPIAATKQVHNDIAPAPEYAL